MDLVVERLTEPRLEFSDGFLHPAKKMGLAEYGPFGKSDPALHASKINVGLVGTRATQELASEWLSTLQSPIKTERSAKRERWDPEENEEVEVEVLQKSLSPDFIGVNDDSVFNAEFVTSQRWKSPIRTRKIEEISGKDTSVHRVEGATDLFAEHIERVATAEPRPDVVIVALPEDISEKCASAELPNGGYLDLRRGLKARAMMWGVPIQLIREPTLRGEGQDEATRAWNFATAMYFKAGGVPWRGHGLDEDTCYIGITFYKAEETEDKTILRTGVAQAFDYLGQGVVLRGQPFEWDTEEDGPSPHLKTKDAKHLIERTLDNYSKISGLPPKRVVIHKSSNFWEDDPHDEVKGLIDGIEAINPSATYDFVTLAKSRLRFARPGKYPPIRGTLVLVGGEHPILYTQGFTPYFSTYRGAHIPDPWHLREYRGDSGPRQLSKEILALSKMNVNNADYADSSPITLAFSRKVSNILKQVGPDMTVRNEYAFYM